ncbi:hypothetical protein BC826DRAFT_995173 [Russula brevipes]|nr:hypothetical protein BC826DRAFT_995173 [Russula brevipes]
MRSSVYVYVLLALPSSLTLAAPLSGPELRFIIPPPGFPPVAIPPPDIPPPDIPTPDEEAVKRADGTLRPVVGQAGHPFFPLPPDLDSPVALPTPILDRDDQDGSPDVLGRFFKGIDAEEDSDYRRFITNKDYRRANVNKDYRRNYVDALHDLLQGEGELS